MYTISLTFNITYMFTPIYKFTTRYTPTSPSSHTYFHILHITIIYSLSTCTSCFKVLTIWFDNIFVLSPLSLSNYTYNVSSETTSTFRMDIMPFPFPWPKNILKLLVTLPKRAIQFSFLQIQETLAPWSLRYLRNIIVTTATSSV